MNKKYKDIMVYCITIILSILYIVIGNKMFQTTSFTKVIQKIETVSAVVNRITDVQLSDYSLGEDSTITDKKIIFEATIKDGSHKGEVVTATQTLDGLMAVSPKDVEERDSVLLAYVSMDTVTYEWVFDEYKRSSALAWLGFAFLGLVVIFGRKKGVNTIVSLIFTCLAIFAVFVPAILAGHNIYVMSVITCIYIVFMSFIIISGANKKTFCSIAGCFGGLTITGFLTFVMDKVLHLTGAIDEEALFLVLLNETHPINLKAIIFGGILVGSLGATMDVSMSICSALYELSEKMHTKTFTSLVKSGFAIGRDMIGTMTNTLILAYIGSSLTIVLLLVANTGSMLSLFNRELIVVEVLQSLVGSLGILFTIPITSLLAAYVYNLASHHKKSKPTESVSESDEA